MAMQSGNTVQRFSYDAQGKVVAVDYSENGGSSYTTYYYLRNAQGDIVKLIDNGGDTKVEYTYDSWGKLLAVTGSHASTIGQNQPFRYRGYVYDGETQWYYLQSRYYDPIPAALSPAMSTSPPVMALLDTIAMRIVTIAL